LLLVVECFGRKRGTFLKETVEEKRFADDTWETYQEGS